MSVFLDLLARAQKRHVPLSAVVELTHACNLHCEMCYLDLLPDHRIGAMSTDEWRGVFRQLADAGCLFLVLTGGELLLRRDWFELATYARSLGFALRLYTNGTLVTEEVADRIASLRPLGVEISLHGATAETQDAISGSKGSFEKVLRGARAIRARGVKLLLKCVVGARNYREIQGIRDIAAELGADVLFDADITPKNDGDRSPTDLVVDEDVLHAVARDIWSRKDGCAHAEVTGLEERLRDDPCAAGRRTCHIGPTGDVFPCTQWPTPIGNLRRERFIDVWTGSPVLAEVRSTKVGDLAGCNTCDLIQACNPCMALSLLEQGNLDGPSQTKCRTAPARAAMVGVQGSPNGPRGAGPQSRVVQLRVPPHLQRRA